MTYAVYVHTLKTDGRKYFGVTCQRLENRWKHGKGYKNSGIFEKAIEDFGWNAFYHHVLKIFTDKEEAYNYEEMLIDQYRSNNIKYGFNRQTGGLHPKSHPDSIKMISESQKGKIITGTALENVRKAAKERDNAVFRHPMSDEVKHKISKSRMGIPCPERAKQRSKEEFSIPVLCVELNTTYPSITEAAKAFGLSKTSISAVLKGRNKTAAGYHWKLYDNSKCGTTIP